MWSAICKHHYKESAVYESTRLADGSLYHSHTCASARQIHLACSPALETTVKALTDHVKKFSLRRLHQCISMLDHKLSVKWDQICPISSRHASRSEKSWEWVYLISFGSHQLVEGHPAPDPLILSMKAVVWSYMTGLELLAVNETKSDVEDDDEFVDHINTLWSKHSKLNIAKLKYGVCRHP